ncbi:MAG: hypothetical protein ABIJ97_03070 [Bacteroidota bacterium]
MKWQFKNNAYYADGFYINTASTGWSIMTKRYYIGVFLKLSDAKKYCEYIKGHLEYNRYGLHFKK